jgi:hypothetical protein
LTISFSE